MPDLFLSKVVSTLPTPLDANALYLVRIGTGFRPYVTNSTGTIVSYGLNPIDWSELTGKPTLLLASNNLSDVASAATSRQNLGTPRLRATTIITSGGSWTKPSSLSHVVVECWGGGGGSAGTSGNGGAGGTTSFGSHLGASGGGGGGMTFGFGGAGGTGTSGDINFGGNSGSYGHHCGGMAPRGGGGGAAFAPSQGGQFPGGGAGSNASSRGAGGGGGYSRKTITATSLGGTETVTIGAGGSAGSGTDGAAGAAGLVIVEEWGY